MNKPKGYFELDLIDPISNESEYHYEGKNEIVINSSTIIALSMLDKYHINRLLIGDGFEETETKLRTNLVHEIYQIAIKINKADIINASEINSEGQNQGSIEGQMALSLEVITEKPVIIRDITEFGLAFVDENNKILFNYKSIAPIQCMNKKIKITWKIIF
jgi:hypothetical protein